MFVNEFRSEQAAMEFAWKRLMAGDLVKVNRSAVTCSVTQYDVESCITPYAWLTDKDLDKLSIGACRAT